MLFLLFTLNGTQSTYSQIAPSDDIIWTDCFDDQKCGRLNLPLDHSNPDGPKIQIALQMLPAKSTTDYKGVYRLFHFGLLSSDVLIWQALSLLTPAHLVDQGRILY